MKDLSSQDEAQLLLPNLINNNTVTHVVVDLSMLLV